jgi:Subtilase family
LDQCNGHGTHVTGIIAGDARNADASQPFVGVAPGATIFMYRVLGCHGTVSDDVVIDAISRAFFDGVDIISMSLGAQNGWTESPTAAIANRAAEKGIFISIAAGNNGQFGLFSSSSPATGPNILSVASSDNIALLQWNALTSNNQSFVFLFPTYLMYQGYFMSNPLAAAGPVKLFITAQTEEDLAADACEPLPSDTPDLSNFVVLVKRGTCTLLTKVNNVAAFGAQLVLYDPIRSCPIDLSIENGVNNTIIVADNANGTARKSSLLPISCKSHFLPRQTESFCDVIPTQLFSFLRALLDNMSPII